MSEGTLALRETPARQPLLKLASDARLAALASQGSAPAFAAIYQRHHQDIYRYCRSILHHDHDARDALQNTMVKAFSALEGEEREISLRPWLFRIAHNESISMIRGRSPDVSIDQVAEVAGDAGDAETRERLQGLIADLDLLTPRQRGALVMRELSGLEFSEIGVALETSADGAKQAVYEARMALRELEQSREVACAEIRERVSADDRRRLRARSVRAHMKSCTDCREFADSIKQRRGQLAAVAPPLPAPIAVGILEGIIGGGGGGGAAVAAAGGGGGVLASLGGGAALKLGAAAVVAAGVSGVALEANGSSAGGDRSSTELSKSAGVEPGGHAGHDSKSSDGSRASSADASSGGAGKPGRDGDGTGSGTGSDGSSAAGSAGGGAAPAAHGGSSAPGANSPAGSAAPEGAGPVGTPPGQGGVPPGQGGTPPGLGTAPPGQGGTPPGQGGSPPGLGGSTPPGLGGTPPGLGGSPPGPPVTPPGQGGTPPGLGGATPPGLGGSPPGQGNG